MSSRCRETEVLEFDKAPINVCNVLAHSVCDGHPVFCSARSGLAPAMAPLCTVSYFNHT